MILSPDVNPLDNTGAVGFPGGTPKYQFRAGLAGLDDSVSNIDLSNMTFWEKVMTSINAQRVFDLNLERAQKGLPPIATSLAAPTVNVGMNEETKKMFMLTAAGLGVVFLLSRSRR